MTNKELCTVAFISAVVFCVNARKDSLDKEVNASSNLETLYCYIFKIGLQNSK